MSSFHLVREYPHSPEKVWRALADPQLVPHWTTTGQGGRPEGFRPEVGCSFRFVAKPVKPFWDAVVFCEVLEVDEGRLLRYSWRGEVGDKPSIVTYLVEPCQTGPV